MKKEKKKRIIITGLNSELKLCQFHFINKVNFCKLDHFILLSLNYYFIFVKIKSCCSEMADLVFSQILEPAFVHPTNVSDRLLHSHYLSQYINLLIINLGKFSLNFYLRGLGVDVLPGAPLTYLMMGGGSPSDFLGSEILAKSDFFGCMKDAGIFLGSGKNQRFFWVAKKGLKDILGMLKNVVIFSGRQILKL